MIVTTPTNERTNCSWIKEISVDNTLIKESWMENMVIPMRIRNMPVRLFSTIGHPCSRGLRDLSKIQACVISVSTVSDAIKILLLVRNVEQAFNRAISNPKGRFGGEVGLITERIQPE